MSKRVTKTTENMKNNAIVSQADQADENMSIEQAANAIKEVIRSIHTDKELKVSLEDEINDIVNSTQYLLDETDSMMDAKNRKRFLMKYKEFLLISTKYVDFRLSDVVESHMK